MTDEAYFLQRAESLNGNIVWCHKIHEKQSDVYGKRNHAWQCISIIFIAMAGTGAVSQLIMDVMGLRIALVVSTLVALFVSIFREAKDYGGLMYQHSIAAREYLGLRESMADLICQLKEERIGLDEAWVRL